MHLIHLQNSFYLANLFLVIFVPPGHPLYRNTFDDVITTLGVIVLCRTVCDLRMTGAQGRRKINELWDETGGRSYEGPVFRSGLVYAIDSESTALSRYL